MKRTQRDHATAESFFHSQHMDLFATAAAAMLNRWSINDLAPAVAIQSILLGCTEDQDFEIVREKYHDIDNSRTRLEADQLKTHAEKHCIVLLIEGIRKAFKEDDVLQTLLCNMFTILKIYLTLPCTSCEAERSFSACCRIKTYLRTTMSQQRINSLAMMHINKEDLDQLNKEDIINEFINKNKIRMNAFAKKFVEFCQ